MLDSIREKRLNRYKYGEIVQQMVVQSSPKSEYKAQHPQNAMQLIERERKRSMELIQRNRQLGNLYMKEANSLAKELRSSSPRLRGATAKQVERKDPVEERRKEAKIKYGNLHEIFKRDKPLDDVHGTYGRIATIKKVDNFATPASQSMAIDMIKQIDRDLLKRERDNKDPDRSGLDRDFMKSIKTKIEVLNQRFKSPDPMRSLQRSADPDQKRNTIYERIKSANKVNKERLKEKPAKLESLEAVQKKREAQAKPPTTDSKPALPPKEPSNKPEAPKQLGKMTKLPEKKSKKDDSAKPSGPSNQKPEPHIAAKQADPHEEVEKAPEDGKPPVPADDPYIKGLSRDLDEDPSVSISPSHQHKLQKDLGEFFDKQAKEEAADADDF